MIDDVPLLRLQDAWRECERHVYHLFHAMSSIRIFWPLTGETYTNLSDEQVQDVDQFILRFTKLQDAMGDRLFPAILRYLKEQYEDRPMLDKLNQLEKLGFINSVHQWQAHLNIRNKFAHDYPEDSNKNAAQLNLAFESVKDLYFMLITVYSRLISDYPTLELGKPLSKNPALWM